MTRPSERQESQQSLFGLDAELKSKEEQKLSQDEYKKMVDEAMNWIDTILGDRGVGSFPDNLKSGRVLCGLINKVIPSACCRFAPLTFRTWPQYWPGIIPHVNDRPITLLERVSLPVLSLLRRTIRHLALYVAQENIRLYLEACEKVGVRKQDLFTISDLYEEKYATHIAPFVTSTNRLPSRYLPSVILNIYALAAIIQRKSSFQGPTLVKYA